MNPAGNRPNGADPAGTSRHGTVPGADRTDVLSSGAPGAPGAPAAPTRAFPASGPVGASLRDPWQESPGGGGDADGVDHTHDPHEVTVQLDAVQFGDGVIRRADSGQHRKSGPEASDGPVFVDASGRRSRLYRRLGIAVGIACAIYAVVIVSTLLSGNSDAPWLPVPGQQDGKPAGQVDTTPLPSQSAQPSATGSADPGTSPTAGAGVTKAPGADIPAPGTSGAATQPGTSGAPGPTNTGTDQNQGNGGATAPGTSQSSQAPPPGSDVPSPPAGEGGVTTDPTGPTGDPSASTDPGAGTAVNGASDSSPVAAGPAASTGPGGKTVVVAGSAGSDPVRTSSSSLSPENIL